MTTANAINGKTLTGLSAVDGKTRTGLSAIDGVSISSPSEVPFTTGLLLALEADHIVGLVDGNSVTTWPDYSSNANNATSSSNPIYRTNKLNGLPGVDFNTLVLMSLTTSVVCNPVSIFAVFARGSDLTNPLTVICGAATGSGQYRVNNGTTKCNWLKASTVDMGSASTSLANGTFYVLGFTYSGSALAFYHNGAADGTASSSQTLSNFTTVGARGDGTEGFAGDIVALLVYNSVLGSTDRGTVTTYLQTKYAL